MTYSYLVLALLIVYASLNCLRDFESMNCQDEFLYKYTLSNSEGTRLTGTNKTLKLIENMLPFQLQPLSYTNTPSDYFDTIYSSGELFVRLRIIAYVDALTPIYECFDHNKNIICKAANLNCSRLCENLNTFNLNVIVEDIILKLGFEYSHQIPSHQISIYRLSCKNSDR